MIASALAGGPGPIIGLALFGSKVRRHQLYNKQVLGVMIPGGQSLLCTVRSDRQS